MKLTFRNCCAHCKCIHDIQYEVQKSCLIYFFDWLNIGKTTCQSRNCVIPVVRVRTLGSVGSRTQLSLRFNFSDYVFFIYWLSWVVYLALV
jgi:hypothetical protein